MRNSLGLAALAMLSIGGYPMSLGNFRQYAAPIARKCLLKDCKNFTTHNGGFCSAKHSKMFKDKLRNN